MTFQLVSSTLKMSIRSQLDVKHLHLRKTLVQCVNGRVGDFHPAAPGANHACSCS